MPGRRKSKPLLNEKARLLSTIQEQFGAAEHDLNVEVSGFHRDDLELVPTFETVRQHQNDKKLISGRWNVETHTVKNESFLSVFIRTRLGGVDLWNAQLKEWYEFKDRIGIKCQNISGNLVGENDSRLTYDYRVRMVFTYRLVKPAELKIRLESGYLYYQSGDTGAVVKDYEPDNQEISINYEWKSDRLILLDPSDMDRKVLVRG